MNKESSIIERLKQYEPLWDGWTYSGKQFGTGGSGCVLGLRRENKFSVVKVIYVDKKSQNYNAVKNEIETMVTLRSDYLVECLDYRIENVYNRKGEVIGYDFLIHMNEYLPFSEYLREEEYDPNRLCIQLAREIGYALCFLHSKGILHRDIKPENIFIDSSNRERHFRLGDFGVSKRIGDMSGLTTTGTLNFMAPESFKYFEYSYRSDIYNLGMTLYYILNDLRFPVFSEEESQSDFDYNTDCRLHGKKLTMPLYGSDNLKKAVIKSCKANPKDRYKDISEMLNDLFGQNIPHVGIKLNGDISATPRRKEEKKKLLRLVSVALAVILVAGIVVYAVFAGCSAANTSAPEETTSFFKEIAGTYSCTAGTKGGTVLMVSKDGSFTGVGQYYVTAVGDEEAPRGEFIFSKFNGTFKNVSKKDEHTYITEISDLTYQSPNGTEEIKNGAKVKYDPSKLNIKSFDRFEIYTPGKPVSELSTQCINWITWTAGMGNNTQLERYILNDIDSGDAFVGSKKENDSKLQSGLWLNYSIQSSTVETYEFLIDRIIVNEYTFANNTVKLSESTQYPQSKLYHKDSDSIVIESSDKTEMILEPTEDENQLQYSVQKPYAREGVLYHRMYHHTELPSYDELVAESKNERNAILSRKG